MKPIRAAIVALAVASSVLACALPSEAGKTLLTSGNRVRVDWPQYQGDVGHTGWDRNEPS